MPGRGFVVAFGGEDEMHFRFVAERGRVVDFAAQYGACVDGVWYNAVRHDSAHGYAHRDVLDARGDTVRKDPVNLPYAEAMQYAQDDVEANQPRYREEFLRRMNR